ncbi:MAG: hypothetical protein IPL61_09700 [Myxococcales bacterium]|nr:hypothetical protein [Myxococcales bacterium]
MWIPKVALAALLAAAACGGKSRPPADKPTDGAPADSPAAPTALDVSKLGTSCGADGACPDGMTCARFYGIAGPSGPEFSSCEVACAGGKGCPAGTDCVTIADGPGAVCRAPSVAE